MVDTCGGHGSDVINHVTAARARPEEVICACATGSSELRMRDRKSMGAAILDGSTAHARSMEAAILNDALWVISWYTRSREIWCIMGNLVVYEISRDLVHYG